MGPARICPGGAPQGASLPGRLLATQGVCDFEPIHKNRRQRLEKLCRWDGEPLPSRLKTACYTSSIVWSW
jgi:hypothetical protein